MHQEKIIFTQSAKNYSGFSRVDEARFLSEDWHRTYWVQVGIPLKDVSTGKAIPVLLMLDGNAAFDELVSFTREQMPAALIVGVGYDTEKHDHNCCDIVSSRSFDYTPPIEGISDLRDPRVPERRAGGADVFLDILQNRLLPAIFEHYADYVCARTSFKVVYGHSYGGLCVLHALFTRPLLFDHWVAVSPSLWWHDHYIDQEAQLFIQQAHLKKPSSLLLAVGVHELLRQRQEETTGTPTRTWARDLSKELSGVANLNIQFMEFSDADHRQAFRASVAQCFFYIQNNLSRITDV